MVDSELRLTDRDARPDQKIIARWVGPRAFARWKGLVKHIQTAYPGVFPADDWVYGGKKYGWGLRFKKTRSFCVLIPERGRVLFLIVLGKDDREKYAAIESGLAASIRKAYDEARVYLDGKWVAFPLDDDALLDDVRRLLALKRKPKPLP